MWCDFINSSVNFWKIVRFLLACNLVIVKIWKDNGFTDLSIETSIEDLKMIQCIFDFFNSNIIFGVFLEFKCSRNPFLEVLVSSWAKYLLYLPVTSCLSYVKQDFSDLSTFVFLFFFSFDCYITRWYQAHLHSRCCFSILCKFLKILFASFTR